jgi:hypothetical protein
MPFHVEIRRSLKHARVFNLTEERLRRTVLDPWGQGQPVELGDQRWDPRKSALRILEGPELSQPDLAFGRGWDSAERSAIDVTEEVIRAGELARVTLAVLAQTPAGRDAAAQVLEAAGLPAASWGDTRASIIAAGAAVQDGSGPAGQTAVVLLIVEGTDPSPGWLFDAGLAIGALGDRALVAQLGPGPAPEQFHDVAVSRLDPAAPSSVQALAARLRRAAFGSARP